jgi:hypothetical protein
MSSLKEGAAGAVWRVNTTENQAMRRKVKPSTDVASIAF